jgi:thiamine pyrophosphokinase
MEHSEIVVVAAGPGPARLSGLPADALVIAADGGLERCVALGLRADVVVGDLDSAHPGSLAAAQERGAEIQRHPTRKDATDLELALEEALARGAVRVLVVASAEGRLDHLLASLLLLGHERYARVELDALVGDSRLAVVRGPRVLEGAPGALVTLLALGGPAEGVTTSGLEYPLHGERLEPGSSRGVSNVFVERRATVSVERGTLLAILPGAAA